MSLLDEVMIAAPCNLAWDEMPGDDRVRHCTGCSKNVYNISAMTKSEAEQFLEQNGTRECMRLYRRVDGTIVTDNCPVGLRKLRDRARKVLRFTAALISNLIAVTCAFAHEEAPRSPSKNEDVVPTRPLQNTTTAVPWENMREVEAYDGFGAMRPHSSNAPARRKGTMFLGSECSSAPAGNNSSDAQIDPPRMLLGKPARPAKEHTFLGIPARPAQGYSHFEGPSHSPQNSGTNDSSNTVGVPGNDQSGKSQRFAADTTAQTLFVNAQAEELRGNYISAIALYTDAIRTAKKNSSSDPKFVKIVESSLLRVRSRILNPGIPSIREQLNPDAVHPEQK